MAGLCYRLRPSAGLWPRRLEKLRQETIANFGQLNEWVETDGVDVAMEMLCRCAGTLTRPR